MSDDTTEYVANSAKCWGRGDYETDALATLVEHWHGDVPDTVEVGISHVRGFEGITRSLSHAQVAADEVLGHTGYEIPRAEFEALRKHVRETDVLAETALVEADSTEYDADELESEAP